MLVYMLMQIACTSASRSTADWMQEAQALPMLPMGLDHAEAASNAIKIIEGKDNLGNRFMGVDFFEECYHSMSQRNKVWYAIFYSAQFRLDGEYQFTFRTVARKELKAIRSRASNLSLEDWRLIGRIVGVDGAEAKKRVYGVFRIN